MIAWRPAAAAMDQERFEVRSLIVGHQSANQGCPPQRAALNQFAILASIGLSTRPNLTRQMIERGFCHCSYAAERCEARCIEINVVSPPTLKSRQKACSKAISPFFIVRPCDIGRQQHR